MNIPAPFSVKRLPISLHSQAPEAFIIFGGLSKSGELIMKPIREAYNKNVMGIFKGKAKIILSEMKEADAAILGASALGWEVRD